MNKNKFYILLIVLAALFLRLFKIEDLPFCINWDEASFGYNSYSILKTARDEYGTFLPTEFKSIGDYKLPLFIYSMVPIVWLFDLSPFSVRLLPAISGSMSVYFLYHIVNLLFDKNKKTKGVIPPGVFPALLLAISPWHIQFTRAGADTGFASGFTLLGIYMALYSIIKNPKAMIWAVLSFSISFYSYFGERVFIPILGIALLIYFRLKLFKNINKYIFAGIVGLMIIVPSFITSTTSGQKEKLFKTTIFGFERSTEYESQIESEDKNVVTRKVFHNSTYEKVLWIFNNYLNHFSPDFLFTTGSQFDQRSLIYRMGMIYLFELPLILFGLYKVVTKGGRTEKFVILWLLISPIPAAITRDTIHARRSLNMIYPMEILSGIGLIWILEYFKSLRPIVKVITLLTSGLFIFYCLGYYFLSYSIFTPLRTLKGPAGWSCGYEEMIKKVSEIESKETFDKIVIDTSYQGPYIFFLFFQKYNPERYQPQARLIQSSPNSLGEGAGYDNYEFRAIYWPDDRGLKNTLFIGPEERIPDRDIDPKQAVLIEKQKFVNGETSFVIVKTLK